MEATCYICTVQSALVASLCRMEETPALLVRWGAVRHPCSLLISTWALICSLIWLVDCKFTLTNILWTHLMLGTILFMHKKEFKNIELFRGTNLCS